MKSNKSVVAPYGTWTSPITAELLTSQTVDITAVDVHVRFQFIPFKLK